MLTVPLDGPYRAALLTGPAALLLVLLLFLLPGADRAGARAAAWRSRGLVTVAATAADAVVVAGPTGLGLVAGLAAGGLLVSRRWGARRARELFVAGAGVGIVAGAAMLSRAPWPDPSGYAGDDLATQVASVAGLVCAGLAAAWPTVSVPSGRAARRRRPGENARRDGSSTSA